MDTIKRVLVGLDLSLADISLINYAAMLCQIMEVDHIYFMHVARDLEVADLMQASEKLGAFDPIDEQLEQKMRAEVDKAFTNHSNISVDFEVVEGNALKELLHWSVLKHIDMVIIGRKPEGHREVLIPEKLARKAPCHVIIVPLDSKPQISSVLLPVDFSDYTKICLEFGLSLISKQSKISLTLLNLYHVPSGYYKMGKTFEEFAAIMESNAKERGRKYLAKVDMKGHEIEVAYSLQQDTNGAQIIGQFANDRGCDLIVIGSKGRTETSVILLGSMAEMLINLHNDIPILVLKKDKENMGILEALLKL